MRDYRLQSTQRNCKRFDIPGELAIACTFAILSRVSQKMKAHIRTHAYKSGSVFFGFACHGMKWLCLGLGLSSFNFLGPCARPARPQQFPAPRVARRGRSARTDELSALPGLGVVVDFALSRADTGAPLEWKEP